MSQYVPYQSQMDKSWSIRAGTTSALENHASTYPVTCLGHVRVFPLSMSGLNCAIFLCKEGPGCRFTPTGLLRVRIYPVTCIYVSCDMPGSCLRASCDKSWSIRAGTTSALENQATTYPVTCLGHVRVLYILTWRPGDLEYNHDSLMVIACVLRRDQTVTRP